MAAALSSGAAATRARASASVHSMLTVNVFASSDKGLSGLLDTFVDKLGFDHVESPRKISSDHEISSVSDGYSRINFWTSSRVSRFRNLFSRPNYTRVTSVSVHPNKSAKDEDRPYDAVSYPMWKILLGNSPVFPPKLHVSHTDEDAPSTDKGNEHLPLLKEIVLAFDSHEGFSAANDLFPNQSSNFPGVHKLAEHSPVVRLIPSTVPSFVLHVQDLSKAEETLDLMDMNGGRIGYNGATHGQVLVKSPFHAGIDIRICNKTELSAQFNEGQEVVMQNVIKGFGDIPHTSQLGCGQVLRKEMVGVLNRNKL